MFLGWQNLTQAQRDTILRGIRDCDAKAGPYHIEFDWTDRCNVHCFFCNNDELNRPGRELEMDIARRALTEARKEGLHTVRLAGGGEPLFHKNIHDLLDLLLELGVRIDTLTTNAVLLNEKTSRKVLDIGLETLYVSLNYPDARAYADEMATAERNFGRVLENLERFRAMEIREGEAFPRIVVQFFLYERTRHQIREMVDLGRRLGADQIYIRDIWGAESKHRIPPEHLEQVKADLRAIVAEDEATGLLELGLTNEGLGDFCRELLDESRRRTGRPPAAARTTNKYCYMPWYSALVRGNGDVFACCMLMVDKGAKPLGNLHESSLKAIWHGEHYARFRRELERVAMLQTRLDFDRQGFEYIFPVCTKHFECPLACGLADETFYEAAEDIHQRKRRSVRGLLTRLRHENPKAKVESA